ncbi:MAG TPA: hypothetical protein VNT01_09090 [Symbiobacteriaceae bacterium]|nr:hypothetical protein [Symbiobacteriaceae bacterium]
MDFLQLRQAVSEAFWQKDYSKFNALMESFLTEACGEDYGRALCLKASWFLMADVKNAAQGFVLVDEAIPLVRKNPAALMEALTIALGLCHRLSDTERARVYEDGACRLLLECTASPEVRARRHRLQLNLGQVAYLRGDFATAYWHFVQAANSLTDSTVSVSEQRWFGAVIQVHIAMSCLRVRRFWEAQEALDTAEQSSIALEQKLRVAVWRAELLRQLGQGDEAARILSPLLAEVLSCDSTDVRGRFYWVSALVAQDVGDLQKFHHFLHAARTEAVEHEHDYLLGEIQRFQRSPI